MRTIEVALFQMLREGWLKAEAGGFLGLRPFEQPSTIHPVHEELLQVFKKRGELSLGQALGLDLMSNTKVERSLIRKGFLLSRRDFNLYRWLAILPIIGVAVYTLAETAQALLTGASVLNWVILSAFALISIAKTTASLNRVTLSGRFEAHEIRKAAVNRLHSAKKPASDGNPTSYDQLWMISDEILLHGFSSQRGILTPQNSQTIKRGA
jgi:uncharacterized protein (TIGR04222 family)